MSTRTVDNPKIVSREEWLVARKKLLAREKQLTRERDAVAAERRQLPWVKVEKNYVFDGPNGKVTLADLFNSKSQLIIYHLMFGPDWQEACPSCSFNMDHTDRHWCISRSATCRSRPFLARPFPKSKPSRSAWAGDLTGFPQTATISTETITCFSPKTNSPRAK